MRLRYTRRALRQLNGIRSYITERNPDAAARVIAQIRRTTGHLATFPRLGHEGTEPGTRQMSVPGLPFVIVYRIDSAEEDWVTILGVFHGAQRR